MTTTKVSASLGALLVITFAAIAYWQYQQIESLKAQNAVLATEVNQSAPTAHALQRKVHAAEAETQQLQQLVASFQKHRPAKAAAAQPGTKDTSNAVALVKHWLQTMEDPELMRATTAVERAKVQRRYLPIMKQLALTPDTQDALSQLLVERKNVALDVAVGMVKDGADPGAEPDLTGALITAQREKVDGEIRQLLGDSGYDQFRAGEQSLGAASVVSMLQQSLEYANAPLTDAQLASIQQVLTANHIGHMNDQVAAAILPTLSPTQVKPFNDFYAEQQAARQAHETRNGRLQNIEVPVAPAPGK